LELHYCLGKKEFHLFVAPQHTLLLKKLCAGCLILLVSLYIIDAAQDSYQAKSTAYLIAQGFVTEKLVSPQSVKFPLRSDDGVEIRDLGQNRYSVSGYLHARNTLGSEQLTRYRCIVRNVGAGEWTYETITFDSP
jgi:hypothetical protein